MPSAGSSPLRAYPPQLTSPSFGPQSSSSATAAAMSAARGVGLPPPSPSSSSSSSSSGASGSPPNSNNNATAISPPSSAAAAVAVYVSHSGRVYDIHCPVGESVSALRETLAGVSGVGAREQILLLGADGTRLQQVAQLQQQSPSSQHASLFLYHKQYTSVDSQAASHPGALVLQPASLPSFELPGLPSTESLLLTPRPHILSHPSVRIRSLPDYERQFRRHLLQCDGFRLSFEDALAFARRALGRHSNTLASLDVALVNLHELAAGMTRQVEAFRKQVQPMNAMQQTVLDNWNADVERLKEVEITGTMRKYVHLPQTPEQIAAATAAAATNAATSTAATAAAPSSSSSSSASAAPASSSSTVRVTLYSCLAPSLPLLESAKHRCASEHGKLSAMFSDILDRYSATNRRVADMMGGGGGERGPAPLTLTDHSPTTTAATSERDTKIVPHVPGVHRNDDIMAKIRRVEDIINAATAAMPSSPSSVAAAAASAASTASSASASFALADFDGLLTKLHSDLNEVVTYLDQLERTLSLPSAGAGAASPASASMVLDMAQQPTVAADRFELAGGEHESLILPQFKRAHEHLRSILLPALADAASAVQAAFLAQMSAINLAATEIRAVVARVPLVLSSFERLNASFRPQLLSISRLPLAYSHLLHELHRRRGFRRSFEQEVQTMANRLARLCDLEERPRRARFQNEHALFLPAGTLVASSTPSSGSSSSSERRATQWIGGFGGLLKLLQDKPPRLDLSFQDFDSALPELEASSLPMLPGGGGGGGSLSPGSQQQLQPSQGSSSSLSSAQPSSPTSASSSSSSSVSAAMHRSASGRDLLQTLPVIDESLNEGCGSASSPPPSLHPALSSASSSSSSMTSGSAAAAPTSTPASTTPSAAPSASTTPAPTAIATPDALHPSIVAAAESEAQKELVALRASSAVQDAKLTQALARIEELETAATAAAREKAQFSASIAASFSPAPAPSSATASPVLKPSSRKGSLGSDGSTSAAASAAATATAATASTSAAGPSSPHLTSTKATSQRKILELQISELSTNNRNLEHKLRDLTEDLARVRSLNEELMKNAGAAAHAGAEAAGAAAEKEKKDAAVMAEQLAEIEKLSVGAGAQFLEIKTLRAQLDREREASSSLRQVLREREDASLLSEVRAASGGDDGTSTISVGNFAFGDTVLLCRNPARNNAFEAFNIAHPNYFLSPDCERSWQRKKQEEEDEKMAKAAQEEASEPKPAAAAASAGLAPVPSGFKSIFTRSSAAAAAAAPPAGAAASSAPPSPAASASVLVPASAAAASSSSSSSSASSPSLVAVILCIESLTVRDAATATKYGLPIGAVYHLIDANSIKSTDALQQQQAASAAPPQQP